MKQVQEVMDTYGEMIKRGLERYNESSYDDSQVSLRIDYSGRGMYGSTCIAISGSRRDCEQAIAEMVKEARILDEQEMTSFDFDDFIDQILGGQSVDSMGHGIVIYWQGITE